MQATTAMTGHGGWPMTCVLDHDGSPFFAGTYFPDQPRHGQPASGQVLQALVRRVAATAATTYAGSPATCASTCGSAAALAGAAPIGAEVLDAAVDDAGARVRRGATAASAARRSSRRRWCSSSCCGTRADRRRARAAMLDATCEAMARGGIYDQLGGGFARYSVDARWVVPHFEKMLYDNAQLLGVYARVGRRRSASGSPRETADFLLRELRTAEGGFASALDADSEGVEGKFYVWTPGAAGRGARRGRRRLGGAGASRSPTAGTFEHGASTLQLLRGPRATRRAAARDVRAAAARGARDAGSGPARDDKVVAAWNGLAITGLVRGRRCCSSEPAYVDAAVARRASCSPTLHLVDGRLRRVSRDGVGRAGTRRAGGPRLRRVRLPRPAAGDRRRGLAGARAGAARRRARRGSAPTTAASSTPPPTPRRWSPGPATRPTTPARPGSRRWCTRWPSTPRSPARAGTAQAAEEALAHAWRRWPSGRPGSPAGRWPPPRRCSTDPLEIAVVGPAGPDRDALERRARRVPGAVVVVADGPREDIPLLSGRTAVDGRPAAYVCRGLVCERPVTDPADLP